MKKYLYLTLALLCMTMAHPVQAQDYVHPDSVFTLSTDQVLRKDPFSHLKVAGTWQIDGAAVDGTATSFKGRLTKPIAKSKLKKKLNKVFKKTKLTSRLSRVTLGEDGRYEFYLLTKKVTGTYDYDPDSEQLTLRILGIPFRTRLKCDGDKLQWLMPTDRFLYLVSLLSDWSKNKTIKDLTFLYDNFDDVQVGFEFKRAK